MKTFLVTVNFRQ